MDEPFAALDAITRDLLHEELERVWRETGRTIVFVTHNVREAARLGERVLLLSSPAGPGRERVAHPDDSRAASSPPRSPHSPSRSPTAAQGDPPQCRLAPRRRDPGDQARRDHRAADDLAASGIAQTRLLDPADRRDHRAQSLAALHRRASLPPVLMFVALLIVVWQFYVVIAQPRPDLVPSPVDVATAFGDGWEIGPAAGRPC